MILVDELEVEDGDFEFHMVVHRVDEIVMLCGLALFEDLLVGLYRKPLLIGLTED